MARAEATCQTSTPTGLGDSRAMTFSVTTSVARLPPQPLTPFAMAEARIVSGDNEAANDPKKITRSAQCSDRYPERQRPSDNAASIRNCSVLCPEVGGDEKQRRQDYQYERLNCEGVEKRDRGPEKPNRYPDGDHVGRPLDDSEGHREHETAGLTGIEGNQLDFDIAEPVESACKASWPGSRTPNFEPGAQAREDTLVLHEKEEASSESEEQEGDEQSPPVGRRKYLHPPHQNQAGATKRISAITSVVRVITSDANAEA
jgi:hypothetical protein